MEAHHPVIRGELALTLAVTAGMTLCFLGYLDGLGVGTVLAAFTMGKAVGMLGTWLDRHFIFVSVLSQREERSAQ